jgi:hypothetical protein
MSPEKWASKLYDAGQKESLSIRHHFPPRNGGAKKHEKNKNQKRRQIADRIQGGFNAFL